MHVGEKLFTFETNDEIKKYSSEQGYNDLEFPYAYGKEDIYFISHQIYIPIQESEYQYLYRKNEEITKDPEGIDIVYGEDFLNCKIIHSNNKCVIS